MKNSKGVLEIYVKVSIPVASSNFTKKGQEGGQKKQKVGNYWFSVETWDNVNFRSM